MRVQKIEKDEFSTKLYCLLTFRVSWEQLVCMIDAIIQRDFKENIYDLYVSDSNGKETPVVGEIRQHHFQIHECPFYQRESGSITIYGASSIWGVDISFTIWNQLDKCLVKIYKDPFIEKEGEQVYDRYLDSIEIEGFVNYTRRQYENKTAEKTKVPQKEEPQNGMMNAECFACHTKFQIDGTQIPKTQKTFYFTCPKCGMELKLGNPNFQEQTSNEPASPKNDIKKEASTENTVSEREQLLNVMVLPKDIRSRSLEEQVKMIGLQINEIKKVLNEIKSNPSTYMLSKRQEATQKNVLNRINEKNYIEAFFELADFVDDYGNRHEGKVFEEEKKLVSDMVNRILIAISNNTKSNG